MRPLMNQWGAVAYYRINQDYIAKNLCVNRDKPMMNCNGQCFLAKKLKAAEDKEQKSTDRGPLDDDKINTALKTKAEESGVPIGIIRAVMRRGLAAWKSGHRPGANQQQWGYARVNAFLTKGEGTWGNADSFVKGLYKISG